ncbi:hypothetical protein ABENE_04525 [Asticcacaulis benevestitus DSM 16100 = ATCC BAA-896]|uniref:Uncharacterized protein n=1 Tax=Asticcacaulis benevestitus DSM 16100 = ATCC BAA-896 TaxID=1121022 RepID=V4RRY5_9CAUL|nr:hypothetical protein ABENE_04525 [Asticcacaulis benevestitus DSM 16100 = ATCC BAA-896]
MHLSNVPLAGKLSIIVAAMAVPLALMTGLFIMSERSMITFSQAEREGVAYIRPLWKSLWLTPLLPILARLQTNYRLMQAIAPKPI